MSCSSCGNSNYYHGAQIGCQSCKQHISSPNTCPPGNTYGGMNVGKAAPLCGDHPPAKVCDALNEALKAPLRPGMSGSTQFFTECGDPASGYFICINEPGTGAKKQIFGSDCGTNPITNPLRLDTQGRATWYTFGKYTVTLIKPDNCGNPSQVVIWQSPTLGLDSEGDTPLNPSCEFTCLADDWGIRLYNLSGGIYPVGFARPKQIAIEGAVQAGQVAGIWSEVNDYYSCKGEPCPDGILVFGDTNKQTYELVDGGDCTVDPESEETPTNWKLICSQDVFSVGSSDGTVSIPPSTLTRIPIATAEFDPFSLIDTGTGSLTIKEDGWYEIHIGMTYNWDVDSNGGPQLAVNGATFFDMSNLNEIDFQAPQIESSRQSGSRVFQLNASDVLDIYANFETTGFNNIDLDTQIYLRKVCDL